MPPKSSDSLADAGRLVVDEPKPLSSTPEHAVGHRERLRERFLDGGANAMPDYELMEMVLFAAIPRRDVKPVPQTPIARFGGFAEAIAAPRARLLEVEGIGEGVVTQLKIIEAAALRLSRSQILKQAAL